jgi:hypothetical protein
MDDITIERICRVMASVGYVSYRGYGEGGPPTIHVGTDRAWLNWEWAVRKIVDEINSDAKDR